VTRSIRFQRLLLSAASLALLLTGCASTEGGAPGHADLVLMGGRIVTVDDDVPEAQALAVEGDRIIAVGSDAEIRPLIGPGTEVIDLEQRLAIPGFIEAHAHFLSIGDAQLQLDLTTASSWDEIVAMVAAAALEAEDGQLIRGRGWHQEKWDSTPEPNVDGVPLHHSLSAVSPDNPVILRHASGHASFANGRAMEMCGIDADTPDPSGGEVIRDAAGNPTGHFRETASGLLGAAAKGATPVPDRRRAELSIEELLAKGVTTIYDAGSTFGDVELYREMVDEGSMGVRLWIMLRTSNARLAEGLAEHRMIGYGDERLTVRAIKQYIDGALGAHGAWLLEPYGDMPESCGLNVAPLEELEETAYLALEHGYQLCTHAIGDRGNRETLDLYERVFSEVPNGTELRWRIEHAQHLDPADVPRFAELGVIAAMQGVHCTSDAPYVVARLDEERARTGAYVWRDLLNVGAVIANGTDAPVEDVDPIPCYYSTVSRRRADGVVFYGEQRLSRMEALRSYTLDAAYSGFEEKLKGSIMVGKLADIVVLSRDITAVPEEEILGTEVVYTIVGGEVAYRIDE